MNTGRARRARPVFLLMLFGFRVLVASPLLCGLYLPSYIIPPPGGIMGAGFASGISATTHSVVRIFLAMDAAFCRAERVTSAGSMMPIFTRSSYCLLYTSDAADDLLCVD